MLQFKIENGIDWG